MAVGTWPPSPQIQAEALRRAFPSYSVQLKLHGGQPVFELVTRDDSNPWCLISRDVKEIWDALKPHGRRNP